jgi:CBS-domain-containing membrane protein
MNHSGNAFANCPTGLSSSAADVMTRNPFSINHDATVREAASALTAKGVSAAPIIDDAGRPVGVVSRADIVRHARMDESSERDWGDAVVKDIMTSSVYFVRPDTPMSSVIDDLLDCNVHRLFVVGNDDVLIGVISTLDVLRHLRPEIAQSRTAALAL